MDNPIKLVTAKDNFKRPHPAFGWDAIARDKQGRAVDPWLAIREYTRNNVRR